MLFLQYYDYGDEKAAAECMEEYSYNWCQYHYHPMAHNHQSRMFVVDYNEYPTLESVMEMFVTQANSFDVRTGKPDSSWYDGFYSVVRLCVVWVNVCL